MLNPNPALKKSNGLQDNTSENRFVLVQNEKVNYVILIKTNKKTVALFRFMYDERSPLTVLMSLFDRNA